MKRLTFVRGLLALAATSLFLASGCCTCNAPAARPKIGIAWTDQTYDEFNPILREVILEAGGEPVFLAPVRSWGIPYENGLVAPAATDKNDFLKGEYAEKVKGTGYLRSDIQQVLGSCKAVVLPGGEDISPTLLKTPQPWHGIEAEKDYNPTRDVSDYLLAAYCMDRKVPVLGLCRGMQMLGVVSGATVIQDIETWVKAEGKTYDFKHREPSGTPDRDYASHDVVIVPGTKLSAIVGPAKDREAKCPSWHHQALASVEGTPLRVGAYEPTCGLTVIEGVERTDCDFAVGVQYHPEAAHDKWVTNAANSSRYMSREDALRYFKALVEACR